MPSLSRSALLSSRCVSSGGASCSSSLCVLEPNGQRIATPFLHPLVRVRLTCLSQLPPLFSHFGALLSRNSLPCNDGLPPSLVGQTYPLFNGRELCHSAHSDASENAPAEQGRQGTSLFQRGREPAPAHREDGSAPRALPGRDQRQPAGGLAQDAGSFR